MNELLADAEPFGGCRPRHQASYGDPGAGGLAGEEVVATLLGTIEDAAELALKAVDGGAQPPRVDLVIVRLEVEIADRVLEPFEFERHVRIIRTEVRKVKTLWQQFYSNQPTPKVT